MALFILEKKLAFPPVSLAEPDGLLAYGGDLSTERLLLAYKSGIFPWYEQDPILWWSPDPRFVLFPGELKVSKSMQQLLNRKAFDFTVNEDFPAVISQCRKIIRKGQDSTWITPEIQRAYLDLHMRGFAVSAEAWSEGKLCGGLYGVRLGKVFFGESMFSSESNASKYAFISFVRQLQKQGVELVDCQVYTQHLESLGARMMPRDQFVRLLHKWCW